MILSNQPEVSSSPSLQTSVEPPENAFMSLLQRIPNLRADVKQKKNKKTIYMLVDGSSSNTVWTEEVA